MLGSSSFLDFEPCVAKLSRQRANPPSTHHATAWDWHRRRGIWRYFKVSLTQFCIIWITIRLMHLACKASVWDFTAGHECLSRSDEVTPVTPISETPGYHRAWVGCLAEYQDTVAAQPLCLYSTSKCSSCSWSCLFILLIGINFKKKKKDSQQPVLGL